MTPSSIFYVRHPYSEGDEELIRSDSSTSNGCRDTFRLIRRHRHRESSYTETSELTSYRKLRPKGAARAFDDASDNVKEGGAQGGVVTPNALGKRRGDQAPKECANTQQAHDGSHSDFSEVAIFAKLALELRYHEEACCLLESNVNIRKS